MKTVVLNADGTPLSMISARRAIMLHMRNTVFPISFFKKKMVGVSGSYAVPSIVALNRYVNVVPAIPKLSLDKLMIRDNSACQYCGIQLNRLKATIDHIIPVSKCKGMQPNAWTNVTLCCKTCNMKKGDRTPDEAGMTLRSKPFVPRISFFVKHAVQKILEQSDVEDKSWLSQSLIR